ncbi:Lrp/AsnC family transcriptional regulator [Saccharothrix violaceirubra]|uniref:DNA-binding Lrp family transcriptional regulator n=1 Tax=Saccharothrix violaceirubra TaxID=413306 RepID=A0A7W7TB54_9PSEU|nr:Lrp/AsnC family transcriptional regulator [Saccharothrix violaceirubra]MBB4968580.1 DNA-binding Lrp family transcriptional regulator [Saccharothrix violaceirubra]
MDEVDSAILRELQTDARITNRDLAARVGIAPSTCLERVRVLRNRGVLKGFHAEVDLKALNRSVEALVAVRVRPLSRAEVAEFERTLIALPEVLTVYTTSGVDDFVVHVAVRDMEHMHTFVVDRLGGRREVVGYRSSMIYLSTKTPAITELH